MLKLDITNLQIQFLLKLALYSMVKTLKMSYVVLLDHLLLHIFHIFTVITGAPKAYSQIFT